jgi:TldD protein
MGFSESFFAAKFGITRGDLESYLAEALSQGGDYADVYFEYLSTSHISIDESIIKSAAEGVSLGVGVRVIAGERTGYAYSDDLSPEKIRKAARELNRGGSSENRENAATGGSKAETCIRC